MKRSATMAAAAACACIFLLAPAQARANRHPGHDYVLKCYSMAGCWPVLRSSVQHRASVKRPFRRHARRHHGSVGSRSDRHSHHGLVAVRAGRSVAYVAPTAAARFQAFLDELAGTGYRIDFMGGWRAHGSCRRCDMHPRGLAIDINQVARNRVTRHLPGNVTAIAARHGILHGQVWHDPDAGHFEIAGVHNYSRHARHRARPHLRVYAKAI